MFEDSTWLSMYFVWGVGHLVVFRGCNISICWVWIYFGRRQELEVRLGGLAGAWKGAMSTELFWGTWGNHKELLAPVSEAHR